MLGCVLVLDTLKAHKDQMNCELRTDAAFLEKYWNLVIESTGFQTVVLAQEISEKMSWEYGGSFSNFYKLGVVVVLKLIGILDEVLQGSAFSTILHILQLHLCLFSETSSSSGPKSASCWDLPHPICTGVSALIALRSGLGECLMLICAWMFMKGCSWGWIW